VRHDCARSGGWEKGVACASMQRSHRSDCAVEKRAIEQSAVDVEKRSHTLLLV
jgi:hypothetical protein